MDDANLKALLHDTSTRQFWIKPWGSRDFPEQPDAQPGTQFFAAPQLEITFAKSKNAPSMQEGDIFLIYHVRMPHMAGPTLVCVTEATSTPAYATTEQLRKELWRTKWPWYVHARNLTPAYGSRWSRFSLNPFRLAKEYNTQKAADRVTLGSINFGATKLRLRQGFARFLLNEIIKLR